MDSANSFHLSDHIRLNTPSTGNMQDYAGVEASPREVPQRDTNDPDAYENADADKED